MNVVVFLPALASLFPAAAADGVLCLEGPCVLGWAWSILALTFASVWIVRRWQAGDNITRRLAPVGSDVTALAPRRAVVALVPRARTSPAQSPVTELADAGLAMRAPPTTDMSVGLPERNRVSDGSPPSHRPSPSTGTPTEPDATGHPSGQHPPA
jgi:hypothetical protein